MSVITKSPPKAIETVYKGHRFRSRLEARWAVYFDAIGLQYFYELEGYDLGDLGYYLPDFYFPVLDCWGEVKAIAFTEGEYEKAAATGCCLLLDGMPDNKKGYYLAGIADPDSYQEYLCGDDYYRVLIPVSANKGRLWFLFGESPSSYYYSDAIECAPLKASTARFEYGEAPI